MSGNFVPTNQEIFQAAIEIIDTTTATSTSASLMLNGGLTIFSTQNALNFNSGGALLILGGTAIQGNTIIGGVTQILNTSIATNTSTGALQISGGLSVQGSAYVNLGILNFLTSNSASIANIICANISVGTLSLSNVNTPNITCQNLYTTNLIVSNISTNSFYINTTSSNSTPTIFGYNSNNTTASGLAFSNWNGTSFIEKARIDNSGNFLINTTQQSNSLYVNCLLNSGSDGGIFDTQYLINPVIGLSVQGSRKYTFGIDSADAFKFKFNRGLFSTQVNTLTLDQNGNVGIGTISPTSSLQVIGDTNVSGNFSAGTSFSSPLATISKINVNNLSSTNITSSSAFFSSTSNSINTSTGAVIINGGLGVGGNSNIGGDLQINGNLTVNGSTITVNSTNISITDNILSLNFNPQGIADSGIQMSRYQIPNNIGSGDVVNDTIDMSTMILVGSTTTNIMFNQMTNATKNYTGYWIKITSGININQVRQIILYNSSTKNATLGTPLLNTPTVGDTFNLYGNVYSVSYFNQSLNSFVLGYTNTIGSSVINVVNYSSLYLDTLYSRLVTASNLQCLNSTISNLNVTSINISNITVSNLVSINTSLSNVIVTSQTVSSQNVTNQNVVNLNITNGTINNSIITNASAANININNVTIGNLNVIGTSNLLGGLVQSINQTCTNATISNILFTNSTFSNLFGSNSVSTNLTCTNSNITNLTVGTLNISSGLLSVSNINNVSLTTSNLNVLTQINTLNLISTNNSLSNIFSNNITCTNSIITNISNSNLLSTNLSIINSTFTNILSSNLTSSNVFITNSTTSNFVCTNSTIQNLININSTHTNILSSNLTSSNIFITNSTTSNMFATNSTTQNSININSSINFLTCGNSIITNLSVGTLSVINNNTTNLTALNVNTTNQTSSNINSVNINCVNISVGSINLTNLNNVNETCTNILSINQTASNLIVNTSSSIVGMNFQYYTNGLSGSWIDIPVGSNFASGIGTGGPGVNPWIAYAGNSGFWFSNAIAGDVCYRNLSGSLLFGNSTGLSTMKISNNTINITSTIDSSRISSSGSLIVSGGINVSKSIDIYSTNSSINNSTGSLVVSGGAGFNGNIYANNIFTYQGSSTSSVLTPSPLNTIGDIYTYSTVGARLPVGSYGQVLMSNTSASTGLQWVSPTAIPNVYGSEYNYISSLPISGTTSTIGSLKTSLTTGSLIGGIYKIEINYYMEPNTSTMQNSEVAVYINTNSNVGFNVGTTTSNLIHQNIYRAQVVTNLTPFCSTIVQAFTSGIQTIGLYYRNQNKDTTNIGNSSILLYRIQ